mmetsp:Transcript_28536/g.85271  ORF Transcript_28536/g.85271 Transcript_28536/m.85271 type:complete len:225 (+) Transcript_28536:1-675(+)
MKRSMKFTAPGQALHCSRLIHIFRPQHSPLSRDREVAQVWHHLRQVARRDPHPLRDRLPHALPRLGRGQLDARDEVLTREDALLRPPAYICAERGRVLLHLLVDPLACHTSVRVLTRRAAHAVGRVLQARAQSGNLGSCGAERGLLEKLRGVLLSARRVGRTGRRSAAPERGVIGGFEAAGTILVVVVGVRVESVHVAGRLDDRRCAPHARAAIQLRDRRRVVE